MLILGLDTALGACSAALMNDGHLIAHVFRPMATGHAEAIAPMTEALLGAAKLAFADLQRIAVTTGPGTFTGQRIGLAFARGLAVALKIPCVGVTTLAAMAAAAHRPGRPVYVASDAKRGECYAQGFDAAGTALGTPQLLTYADAAGAARALGDNVLLAGTAAGLLDLPLLTKSHVTQPDAIFVAQLGLAAAASDTPPAPLYLRAPDAKVAGPLKAPPPQRRDRA